MNRGELNDLKIIISQLVEYYKELEDLKSAGLDIIKLAPVSILNNTMRYMLNTKYSICIAEDIISYAQEPTVDMEHFFNILCEKYALKYDEDKDDGIHGVEFCIKDPNYQDVRKEDLKVTERFHKKPEEELAKEMRKNLDKAIEYYVNGKKVAKDAYVEIMLKLDNLFGNLAKLTDE